MNLKFVISLYLTEFKNKLEFKNCKHNNNYITCDNSNT